MAAPAALLCPFGTTAADDWFNKSMAYEQSEIFAWLDSAMNGRAGGDATKDETVQKELKAIYNKMKSLSLPNGADYLQPEPLSHILRENTKTPEGADALKVVLWPPGYRYAGITRTTQYFTPYDLLGLFLSLLGPAPAGANLQNYFMPMTIVYAKWCSYLGGAYKMFDKPNPGQGAGYWPYMFQCTWRPVDKESGKMWFFLGASSAGDSFTQAGWQDKFQRARYAELSKAQSIASPKYFDQLKGLVETATNPLGNCGETYPLTHLLTSGNPAESKKVFGLAVNNRFIDDKGGPKSYTSIPKRRLKPAGPCATCSFLIKLARGNRGNFAGAK